MDKHCHTVKILHKVCKDLFNNSILYIFLSIVFIFVVFNSTLINIFFRLCIVWSSRESVLIIPYIYIFIYITQFSWYIFGPFSSLWHPMIFVSVFIFIFSLQSQDWVLKFQISQDQNNLAESYLFLYKCHDISGFKQSWLSTASFPSIFVKCILLWVYLGTLLPSPQFPIQSCYSQIIVNQA